MRRFLALLLMAALATVANADPNLVGQWKSDSELSMRFNNERAKLDSKTALFLSQLMGHMTLTFTADAMTSELPDLETKTQEGRKRPLTGFRENPSLPRSGHCFGFGCRQNRCASDWQGRHHCL